MAATPLSDSLPSNLGSCSRGVAGSGNGGGGGGVSAGFSLSASRESGLEVPEMPEMQGSDAGTGKMSPKRVMKYILRPVLRTRKSD